MKFTIHTLMTVERRRSLRCVEADNIHEALLLLAGGQCREQLREGEIPMAWSPEPTASRGGTKHGELLLKEAKEDGRLVAFQAGVPVAVRIPPEERKLDPTSDRDSLGVIRNRVQWQLEACGANRTPFDPFKGFYKPGDVESSVTSTGPHKSGVFGHSPDLARTGHQIAPVFGSAKIALGEL